MTRALPPTVAVIIAEVATTYGVNAGDIFGKSRDRRYVIARHAACARLRGEIQIAGKAASYARIADWMGLDDHTSVIHAVRAHAARGKSGFAAESEAARRTRLRQGALQRRIAWSSETPRAPLATRAADAA